MASLKDESLAEDPNIRLIALFDNEEVGSETAHGAGSNLLESTMRRITHVLDEVSIYRILPYRGYHRCCHTYINIDLCTGLSLLRYLNG